MSRPASDRLRYPRLEISRSNSPASCFVEVAGDAIYGPSPIAKLGPQSASRSPSPNNARALSWLRAERPAKYL